MSECLRRAVQVLGGQSALAKAIGVTPQAVQQWMTARHVPARRAIQIEQATAGAVTRHDLRPDLYPAEPATTTSEAA